MNANANAATAAFSNMNKSGNIFKKTIVARNKMNLARLKKLITNGNLSNETKKEYNNLQSKILSNMYRPGVVVSAKNAKSVNNQVLRATLMNNNNQTNNRVYFKNKARDISLEIDAVKKVIQDVLAVPDLNTDLSAIQGSINLIYNSVISVRREFISKLKKRFLDKNTFPRVYVYNPENIQTGKFNSSIMNNIKKNKFKTYQALANNVNRTNAKNKDLILNIINPATTTSMGDFPAINDMDRVLLSLDFYISRYKTNLSNNEKKNVERKATNARIASEREGLTKMLNQLEKVRTSIVGASS